MSSQNPLEVVSSNIQTNLYNTHNYTFSIHHTQKTKTIWGICFLKHPASCLACLVYIQHDPSLVYSEASPTEVSESHTHTW